MNFESIYWTYNLNSGISEQGFVRIMNNCCLDKARVKKAINKITTKLSLKHTGARLFNSLLLEELGLEE